ncbi:MULTISPECIES: carboxylate--amine ligase [Haloferax]|uniref:carboxylate--amine ligase n=1 Tax=Haloferax TaxID=2251 RepID=UPI001CD95DAB|nr:MULTISPECIES: carboxylate--amine ligase [Haloferax]
METEISSSRRAVGTVVIPGIAAPSSVACVRSLGRRGINTIVVSENPTAAAFSSKYCDEAVVTAPPTDTEAYRDELLALARRPDVRAIIPVREEDIYVLSRFKDEFAEHIGTPWPSFETLRRVQDRKELFEAAAEAGVPAPKTRLFDEWDDWDQRLIVKSRYNLVADEYLGSETGQQVSGRGTTQYVEQGETPVLDDLLATMNHVPIVQEYVPTTDEYGFFALYDDGEAVATFQHRQIRGYKYAGGPSSFRESVSIPELDAAGRRLLDHLEWDGLAMVEFLRDPETGEFKLMEINPRFWSSLPFTVQAGVDFPYYYWLLANGRRDEIDSSYRVGIAGHLIRGELLYLHSVLFDDFPLVERPSRLKAFADVAWSLVKHPRFDYLDFDDYRPFVRDLANGFVSQRRAANERPERVSVPPERDPQTRLLE